MKSSLFQQSEYLPLHFIIDVKQKDKGILFLCLEVSCKKCLGANSRHTNNLNPSTDVLLLDDHKEADLECNFFHYDMRDSLSLASQALWLEQSKNLQRSEKAWGLLWYSLLVRRESILGG